jgi:predicted ATPase/Tfp pilus assembly protein PilF
LGEQRFRDGGQPENLYQLSAPELRADFPPPMTLTGLPNNLPPQTTSFIGRQTEIGEIRAALSESARANRLLTLVGVGGTGKTRLALQVALEELENFEDGVWFVELAPVADDKQVINAFAGTLGVREEPKRPLQDSLTDFLAEKRLLLVVDNCEHLIVPVARLVETLLKSCPKIENLATSREGLSLPGEKTYAVPALSLPDLADLPVVEKLLGYGAIRLFVERATAALPTFGLTAQNALAVAQICHRLDGIPLALELAAARIKVLAPEQIFARLDSAIRLLTTGSQTLPTRQQTIRGAIDWSYDLLTDVEKLVLQRLAVFAGGWSLEAAEKIVTDDMVDEFEVLDWLTKLVDKSLVVADIRDDETRYRLLETIRQYAGEKLAANDPTLATETRRKHLDWFASFGEKAEPQMRGAQQVLWLGRAEQEHDNFLAALEWSRTATDEPNNFETGLRLAGALWMYWFLRGHLSLGQEWLEGSTTQDEFGTIRPKIKAKTLAGASQFAFLRGDYREALSYAEEALAIYRTLADKRQIAFVLTTLGQQYSAQGDFTKAITLLDEALTIGREVRDKWNIANTLSALGVIAGKQRDIAKLKAYLEESLSLRRETGDQQGTAVTLINLAGAIAIENDLRQAAALLQESLNITRELKDLKTSTRTLTNLGLISIERSEFQLAHHYFEEALLTSRKLGDQKGILLVLKGLTNLAYIEQNFTEMRQRLGDMLTLARKLGDKFTSIIGLEYAAWMNENNNLTLALRLASVADAQREIMKVKITAKEQTRHDNLLEIAREKLDPVVYATESEQGRQMTLEGAIAMALYET